MFAVSTIKPRLPRQLLPPQLETKVSMHSKPTSACVPYEISTHIKYIVCILVVYNNYASNVMCRVKSTLAVTVKPLSSVYLLLHANCSSLTIGKSHVLIVLSRCVG